ncbi:hypothetical protein PENFLA_c004G06979 [Penicillium flavigenum]|uniref:Uncharacterized protein n=1 Tax=Penicillium flavigenum TaxID=254877 RepID=A0A1V6TSZ1_9EURO|nr:hypothetical protein PENFLA_c004G06979 [Penicillium flavigenum]
MADNQAAGDAGGDRPPLRPGEIGPNNARNRAQKKRRHEAQAAREESEDGRPASRQVLGAALEAQGINLSFGDFKCSGIIYENIPDVIGLSRTIQGNDELKVAKINDKIKKLEAHHQSYLDLRQRAAHVVSAGGAATLVVGAAPNNAGARARGPVPQYEQDAVSDVKQR